MKIQSINRFFVILIVSLFIYNCLQVERSNLDSSSPKGLQFVFILAQIANASNVSPTFVAVGDKCMSSVSFDGKTWDTKSDTSTVFPGCTSSATIHGVAYGNGVWVAVGSTNGTSGCGIWVSADASTWTQKTCAGAMTVPLKQIAFGSNGVTNRFYAVGDRHNGVSSSPAYFNGQTSSDNGETWTSSGNSLANIAAYDNPSIATIVYNTSSNSFLTHDNSSVTTYLNITGIDSPLGWVASGAPNLTYNGAMAFKMLSLPSGSIIAYGDTANKGGTQRGSNTGTGWTTAINNKFALDSGNNYISTLVYGEKLVALGPNCLVDYSLNEAQTNAWSGASTATEVKMNGCSGLLWTASAYSTATSLYIAGSSGGKIAYSSTGIPSDWTILDLGVTNQVRSIAVRQ